MYINYRYTFNFINFLFEETRYTREYFLIYKFFPTLYEENFGTFYQHRNIALINGERIPEISAL